MAASVLDSILLYGDSLTQGGWEPGGFAQRLAVVYNRKFDIVNRGMNGYNSRWGLTVLKQIFPKKHQKDLPTVRLMTIWWGANDAVVAGEHQHVALPEYLSNIREHVSLIRSPDSGYYSPKTRMILIAPPPVNLTQRLEDTDRNETRTKEYSDALVLLAHDLDVPVFDSWNVFTAWGEQNGSMDPLFSDGLHLTSDGYKLVYDGVMQIISSKYPELLPQNIGRVYPAWDLVDPENIRPKRLDV